MQPRILLLNGPATSYYRDAVAACGGIPVEAKLPEVSTDFDGLILCGGADLHPELYGQAINGSVNISPERDANDLAFARAFLDAGKPILGIYRGHQVLNVFFGGSLHQHLPTTEAHRASGDAVHPVVAEEESFLSRIYGQRFVVNSQHHQAVNRLGEGLRVTLRCEADGTVEAFEHTTLPVWGVQFHPERMCLSQERQDAVNGLPIFRAFLELCGAKE
jgi:putative glutamine amidotransferase